MIRIKELLRNKSKKSEYPEFDTDVYKDIAIYSDSISIHLKNTGITL